MSVENEDGGFVGKLHMLDAQQSFYNAAVAVGLIKPGNALNNMLVDYAELIVSLCAKIGDCYEIPNKPEDTVGDHIRVVYLGSSRIEN